MCALPPKVPNTCAIVSKTVLLVLNVLNVSVMIWAYALFHNVNMMKINSLALL